MGRGAPGFTIQRGIAIPLKRTLVVDGDSWANLDAPSGTGGVNAGAKGIMRAINALLQNYFEIVATLGVSGETIAQVAARLPAALAYSSQFVAFIDGLNSLVQSVSAENMFAQKVAVIESVKSAGAIPIIFPCQITAVAYTTGVSSAAQAIERARTWSRYNRLLDEYANDVGGFIYLSKAFDNIIDQAFVDPTYSAQVPALLDRYAVSVAGVVSDHTHPGIAGTYRIAKDAVAQLSGQLPTGDVLPRNYYDSRAAAWNCLQLASGTPSTGGIVVASTGTIIGKPAAGWMARLRNEAAAAQCTISQVERTDLHEGFWTKCECINMDQNSQIELRTSESSAFNYSPWQTLADHGIVAGDEVEFYLEMKIHSVSGNVLTSGELNAVRFFVQTLTAAGAAIDLISANADGGSSAEPFYGPDMDDTPRVISTVRYTIPATMNQWFSYAYAAVMNTGATGLTDFTFELGRTGIRKLS